MASTPDLSWFFARTPDFMNETPSPDNGPIETRSDTGSGFCNVGWPLIALGLIVLMTVHSCMQ